VLVAVVVATPGVVHRFAHPESTDSGVSRLVVLADYMPPLNGQVHKVQGIELPKYSVTGKRTQLPDVFETSDRYVCGFATRSDVIEMQLPRLDRMKPYTPWVYYVPSKKVSYLRHRVYPNYPRSEQFFGPIPGDPAKLFGVAPNEWQMMAVLKDIPSTKRVLDTMIQTLIKEDQPPEHLRWQRVLGIQNWLEAKSALLEELGLTGRAEYVAELAEPFLKEYRPSIIQIAEDQYSTPRATDQTIAVPRDSWGEPVNGMRAGLLLNDAQSDDRGSIVMAASIMVQNVSDHEIRFSDMNMDTPPLLVDAQGRGIASGEGLITSLAPPPPTISMRMRLEPGEKTALDRKCELTLIRLDENGKPAAEIRRPIKIAQIRPGKYLVSAQASVGITIWQNQSDGSRLQTMPAVGEWSGVLRTGSVWISAFEDAALASRNESTPSLGKYSD